MKKIFIITLAISFYCFGINAQGKSINNTMENTKDTSHKKETAFGLAVFNAMKANNIHSWILLYPTDEEYKKILLYFLAEKKEGLSLQNIDEMIERLKKEAFAVYNERYINYRQQADSLGINWEKAGFEKYEYTIIYPDDLKLKYLTGRISFKHAGKKYFIDGVDAVELETGYRLQTVNGIRQAEVGE